MLDDFDTFSFVVQHVKAEPLSSYKYYLKLTCNNYFKEASSNLHNAGVGNHNIFDQMVVPVNFNLINIFFFIHYKVDSIIT